MGDNPFQSSLSGTLRFHFHITEHLSGSGKSRMREALPELLPWLAANYTAKWEYSGWRQCLEVLFLQQRSEKHSHANRKSKAMPKYLEAKGLK